jgi:hypothetical protein
MGIHPIQSTRARRMLFFLFCFTALLAQTRPAEHKTEFETTVAGIQDYDIKSIRVAGDSDNKAYVPYLRALLIHRSTPTEVEATIALVKLGDSEQMRNIECELLTNKPGSVTFVAGEILPSIKGWFAIREYFYMLGQDHAFIRELATDKTDVLYSALPSELAVLYLPTVVPKSPMPVIKRLPDPRVSALKKRWRMWIIHHRVELEKLRPRGPKGLTFSNVGCPLKGPFLKSP